MKEVGMIFSAPMVKALLSDRKWQTRRLFPAKLRRFGGISEFGPSDTKGYDWHFRDKEARWQDMRNAALLEYLRPQVGDTIWVRETWAQDGMLGARYYATDDVHELRRKRPAIHMPRWASRIQRKVLDVKIERLNDISEDDALAEGVGRLLVTVEKLGKSVTAREGYASLWNEIHGAGAWEKNPWVVAITFERAS